MQHEEIKFRTVLNMLDNGASIDDTVKFYRIASNCACPAPVTNVAKPKADDPNKADDPLLAQFRKEYPGAPAAAPVTAPRINTSNIPPKFVDRFTSAWPGAPGVTR